MRLHAPVVVGWLTWLACAAPAARSETPLPVELRVRLTGDVRDEPFENVPATLRVRALGPGGEIALELHTDDPSRLGTLEWPAPSQLAREARVPPFETARDGDSVVVRLRAGTRHTLELPTWASAGGLWAQAETGFARVHLDDRPGTLGEIALSGHGAVSGRPSVYRARIDRAAPELAAPPARATTAAGPAPIEQASPPERRALDEGYALLFERRWAAAVRRLESSRAAYARLPRRDGRESITALLGQKNALSGLIHARFRLRQWPALVATLEAGLEVDRRLARDPALRQAAGGIAPSAPHSTSALLETWRRGLRDERARIDALTDSQDFFEALLASFLERGESQLALEAAELARARALADRLEPQGRAPEPLDAAEMARLAHDLGSTLIEYHVAADMLHVWVVRGAAAPVLRTVPVARERLRRDVREWVAGLELGHETPRLRSLARGLYAVLLEPVGDLLPSDARAPVVVVPHDVLARAPFAALRFDDGPGEFAVRRHALAYAPSLAVLSRLARRAPAPPAAGWAAFVSPAPLPEPAGALPEALESALTQLEATLGGGRTFARTAASEAAFKRESPQARWLVLGTHAFTNRPPPARRPRPPATAVLLGRGTSPRGDDGYLTRPEIERLTLRCDLVVLLACQTGLGEITADGVQGLARSFFTAGAGALLVTHWSVAADLAVAIAHATLRDWLLHGRTLAQALQSAQQAGLQAYPDDPGLWAGLALIGPPGLTSSPAQGGKP